MVIVDAPWIFVGMSNIRKSVFLTLASRAVELAEAKFGLLSTPTKKKNSSSQTDLSHSIVRDFIRQAADEMNHSTINNYVSRLALVEKIFLVALLNRIRRTGVGESNMSDIIEEVEILLRESPTEGLKGSFTSYGQLVGLVYAARDLQSAGILALSDDQRATDRLGKVVLTAQLTELKGALRDDQQIQYMLKR